MLGCVKSEKRKQQRLRNVAAASKDGKGSKAAGTRVETRFISREVQQPRPARSRISMSAARSRPREITSPPGEKRLHVPPPRLRCTPPALRVVEKKGTTGEKLRY